MKTLDWFLYNICKCCRAPIEKNLLPKSETVVSFV